MVCRTVAKLQVTNAHPESDEGIPVGEYSDDGEFSEPEKTDDDNDVIDRFLYDCMPKKYRFVGIC